MPPTVWAISIPAWRDAVTDTTWGACLQEILERLNAAEEWHGLPRTTRGDSARFMSFWVTREDIGRTWLTSRIDEVRSAFGVSQYPWAAARRADDIGRPPGLGRAGHHRQAILELRDAMPIDHGAGGQFWKRGRIESDIHEEQFGFENERTWKWPAYVGANLIPIPPTPAPEDAEVYSTADDTIEFSNVDAFYEDAAGDLDANDIDAGERREDYYKFSEYTNTASLLYSASHGLWRHYHMSRSVRLFWPGSGSFDKLTRRTRRQASLHHFRAYNTNPAKDISSDYGAPTHKHVISIGATGAMFVDTGEEFCFEGDETNVSAVDDAGDVYVWTEYRAYKTTLRNNPVSACRIHAIKATAGPSFPSEMTSYEELGTTAVLKSWTSTKGGGMEEALVVDLDTIPGYASSQGIAIPVLAHTITPKEWHEMPEWAKWSAEYSDDKEPINVVWAPREFIATTPRQNERTYESRHMEQMTGRTGELSVNHFWSIKR